MSERKGRNKKSWMQLRKSGEVKASMKQQPLWKISDVAQYLGIPLKSVYSMTSPKAVIRIPHIRIAGKVRFRKVDIDLWLDQCTVVTSSFLASVPFAIGGRFNRN
jgi:predicted DNA-binding transcriptional regulator AlpA